MVNHQDGVRTLTEWISDAGIPNPPRVVVAEDSKPLRHLVTLLLRTHGFDVAAVRDGKAALEAIRSDGADCLVSDLYMPGLDGLTLTRMLRSLRAYVALPIVVFTAAAPDDPRVQPLHDLPAVRVLHKPTDLQAIAPALVEMIASTANGGPWGGAILTNVTPAASLPSI